MIDDILVEAKAISKVFPGIIALDKVDFKLRAGSVHALMGENGAGKSTFVKCLMGLKVYDSGSLFVKGNLVRFSHPKQALDYGVSIIEQELTPVIEMTVAENIFLGREPVKNKIFLDYNTLNKNASKIIKQLNVDIDVTKKMSSLSQAEIQLVEIAKALSYDSDIIIMDEPTSSIGSSETEILFNVIRHLKSLGKGIIYVSHRMSEIFTITDEITIFRDGKWICTLKTKETTHEEVVIKMIGKKVSMSEVKRNKPSNDKILEVVDLSDKKIKNANMSLNKGEILGFFGLIGSGRSEFCDILFGINKPNSGSIFLDKNKIKIKSPTDAINNKIAYVTEDRKTRGLYLKSSVKYNISINSLKSVLSKIFINNKKENDLASKMVEAFSVKTSSLNQLIVNLSGGNQQKVILARWISTFPNILILDEPTRGIDIGSKLEIYKFMSEFVSTGKSIILISSELPEILSMSDRIYIFSEGSIVKEFSKYEADESKLMHYASLKASV